MNFREYIEFVEAMTMSAGDIKLDKSDEHLGCRFMHDGENYNVEMWRFKDDGIDYIWSVDFDGPKGTNLTGKAGTASSIIYNKMLSCVKKLFEIHPVNGLSFTAGKSTMKVPYDLFYRNFLRPNPPNGAGFLKVDNDLYLSKDKVKEMNYTKVALSANRFHMADVENVKNKKAIERILKRTDSGKAFPTDFKTLEDLEKKDRDIEMKLAQAKKNHQAALQRRHGGWEVVQ